GTIDGVTPNDNQDPDVGSNNLQNFPVISSAKVTGTTYKVTGTFNSTPNTSNYTLEFFKNASCDGSGNGEGQTYLGNLAGVSTDASGDAAFTFFSSSPFGVRD